MKRMFFLILSTFIVFSTGGCSNNNNAENGNTNNNPGADVNKEYAIRFVDYDGTIIKTETLKKGEVPTPPEDPIRQNTEYFDYSFAGWDSVIVPVTKDVTYTAQYASNRTHADVRWYNFDNTLLDEEKCVEVGTLPKMSPVIPYREEDDDNFYMFDSWSPELSYVVDDQSYYAQYDVYNKHNTYIFVDNVKARQIELDFNCFSKIDWGDGTINSSLTHSYSDNVTSAKIVVYPDSSNNRAYMRLIKGQNYVKQLFLGDSIKLFSCTGFSNLETVKLPQNLELIPYEAFYDCLMLENIVLPSNLKKIDDYAFINNSKLRYLEIPSSVEYIGTSNFYCSNDYLFDSCYPVLYKGSCDLSGSDSFQQKIFTEYDEVVVKDDCTFIIKGDEAILSCCRKPEKELIIDDYVSHKGKDYLITDIAYGCFALKEKTSLVLPSGLKHINDSAFNSASKVKTNDIDECCYFGCNNNPYFVLVNSTSTYPENPRLHEDCRFIKLITSNNWFVDQIPYTDFYNIIEVDAKTNERFVNLGYVLNFAEDSYVVNFRDFTFYEYQNINYKLYNDGINCYAQAIKYLGSSTYLTIPSNVQYEGVSYTVVSIGSYFTKNTKVEYVNLPSSIKYLMRYSFCTSLYLNRVTAASTLDYIGEYSFYETNIESFDIDFNMDYIPTDCFCFSSLTSFNVNKKIKRIESGAFFACYQLTQITLNEGLEYIGVDAFGSTKISSIVIPSTVKICDDIFSRNNDLTYVTINADLEHLRWYIEDVPNLNYIIENGLKYLANKNKTKYYLMGVSDFSRTSFVVSDKCVSTSHAVFGGYQSTNLKSVIFPSRLNYLSSYTFDLAHNLETIVLEKGADFIGKEAFCSLESLTTLNLGDVSVIDNIFNFCPAMTEIKVSNAIEKIGYLGMTFPIIIDVTDVTHDFELLSKDVKLKVTQEQYDNLLFRYGFSFAKDGLILKE